KFSYVPDAKAASSNGIFAAATNNTYQIVLADLRDPGNLGTIIRIADWYGIHQIVCSNSTVDWYNPKVIMSSMGSFLRVQPYYCELPAYFEANSSVPVYG
ncbi:MAG: TrmH family RNA methyltransferase, partial [Thermoflexibacteraceae bacterium]